MASITSIALSGMTAAQTRLGSAAHNIANVNTEGFVRQQTQQTAEPGGGTLAQTRGASAPGAALESDMVEQLQAKNVFLANLAVFKTQDQMAGTLLSQKV